MNFVEFVILDTLLVLLLGTLTFVFFFFFRKPQLPRLPDKDLPFVSVVVPVRNEERKIRRCLDSLLKQKYPYYEIIVVDDRSTDSSAAIITELAESNAALKFLSCHESRPGWLGKCNALDYASKYASGSWLAFIDADTFHHSESLRYAICSAIMNGVDLISFMPVQELGTFSERAIMPVLLGSFLLGDPLNRINDDENPRAYAYGQYFLIKRTAYDAVGGHESVKDEILDDISMGQVVKRKGFRITAVDGRQLYVVRMYTNLEELWRGWTKNIYALIGCNPLFLIGVLLLLNLTLLAPYCSLAIFIGMIATGVHGASMSLVGIFLLVQFLSIALWFWRTGQHYKGIRPIHILAVPLGVIGVSALYINSAICFISGFRVTWKDRKYCVNTSMKIRPPVGVPDHAGKV